jgi:hypothetical protein
MPWLISAVMAAIVAVAITVIIERLGGRKGGLIGTVPSTVVPAAVGLWLASPSVSAFQEALYMVPAGMLINALFLLLWRIIPPALPAFSSHTRLALSVILTTLGWTVMAAAVVLGTAMARKTGLDPQDLALILIGLGIGLGVMGAKNTGPSPSAARKAGPWALASRGLLAAFTIGGCVWLAAHAGPMMAGMAAVFPALFLTTMVSLWLVHGEAVGDGAVGPMMLGGTAVSVFAWLAASWIPELGPLLGCVAAWVAAVASTTVPAWLWLNS